MNMCAATSTCHLDGGLPDGSDGSMCTGSCIDGGGGDANVDLEMPDLMPRCTSSTVATDCTNAAAPVCDTSTAEGACIACRNSGDDGQCAAHANGKNHCKTAGGPCVQCNGNGDCSGTTPICDNNACRGCNADSDCTSKVCEFSTGACVDASMIALVDHGGLGVTACNTARTGTQTGNDAAHAWCDVPTAVSTDARRYLLVTGYGGGAMSYNLVPTIGRDVTIVGPGGSVAAGSLATISGSNTKAAVTVDNVHTVVLDGLELTAGATGNSGVNCSQPGATLVVRSSLVDGNNGAGINTNGCAVTLLRNAISSNNGGGIKLSDGTYSVVNNFITDNGNTGPGVSLAGNISGLFWFNTIAGNTRTGANAGAFNCGGITSANAKIQASIVFTNAKTAGGASITTGCDFVDVDIDDTTTPTGVGNSGNFNTAPNFVGSGNTPYAIQSPSPCMNVFTLATAPTGGTLPTNDFAGTARPRASTGGYDIGCWQVVP
jgi:hypothetical protein